MAPGTEAKSKFSSLSGTVVVSTGILSLEGHRLSPLTALYLNYGFITEQNTMLRIAPKAITYRGWHVKVAMQNHHFVFQCYPPEQSDYANDGYVYANFRTALMAACHFIDREVAIRAVIEVMQEWLETRLINEAEYWNLTAFD